MKFRENGPDIPNELLEARDHGEVVFFCGAGVSMPAGLPSFLGLAQRLVSELRVPADAVGRRLLDRALAEPEFAPSLDQVLGQLQRDYSNEQIERVLSRCLRAPRNADLRFHRAVLRLSTDSVGRPRLVGEMRVGGVVQERSRRTVTHALNSPVGPLVEMLLTRLNGLKLRKGRGIPTEIRNRMERAIAMPGEGSDHAVLTLTRQVRWLYRLDPTWVRTALVPLFSVTNTYAEPAWAGYLSDAYLPEPSLFELLKPSFLELFRYSKNWSWEHQSGERLADFLVVATFWGKRRHGYIRYSEAHKALQEANATSRQTVLWRLARCMNEKGGWKAIVKPFLERAWPLEERFQTAQSSRHMVDIAAEAGSDFPDVVRTVLDFVRPVDHSEAEIFHFTRSDAQRPSPLATEYPEETLSLIDRLVPPNPAYPPYELARALALVAEAQPSLRQDLRWRRLTDLLA